MKMSNKVENVYINVKNVKKLKDCDINVKKPPKYVGVISKM